MNLTVKQGWLEPGFVPDSLYESPFQGFPNRPYFHQVTTVVAETTTQTLEAFAADLVGVVQDQIDRLQGPAHCLLSGGYDSRLLAALLERSGKQPLYVTDGTEEPEAGNTLDLLGVPERRRFTYDLDRPDPYGLTDAACEGFAPLYSQMRFMPADPEATLVTGLGGGEWFSYPASGWHNGKKPRVPHTSLVNQWLDCWPQYTLLPEAWGRGYREMLNPYCTPLYAHVAAQCRPEWLVEVDGRLGLDLVREAMLDTVDGTLAPVGWKPHVYDWNLTVEQAERVDERYASSWLARTYRLEGQPSLMDADDHACTLAGFASWCDKLIVEGHTLV